MGSRLELHQLLIELLGNTNVYYNPPDSVKMKYPAIRYSVNNIDKKVADNAAYLIAKNYKLVVIDSKPDNAVIDKLLQLPYCSFNTHYVADNLNHDVLSIYY